jgi:hypothetical protein
MFRRALRGRRYLQRMPIHGDFIKRLVFHDLPRMDHKTTLELYSVLPVALSKASKDERLASFAFLGCNDRFYLLTQLLDRPDVAEHPWLFARCREVEAEPDGYIDLWSRFHYKSTIITFGGAIQEVLCNPEIKIAIFSATKPIAEAFLKQIKEEFENRALLKLVYSDVLYQNPRTLGADGRPAKWGVSRGIT